MLASTETSGNLRWNSLQFETRKYQGGRSTYELACSDSRKCSSLRVSFEGKLQGQWREIETIATEVNVLSSRCTDCSPTRGAYVPCHMWKERPSWTLEEGASHRALSTSYPFDPGEQERRRKASSSGPFWMQAIGDPECVHRMIAVPLWSSSASHTTQSCS
jgi:hypothetical protein